MPALPAPRPLPLSAYRRFGSPIPFATANVHSAIPNRHLHGYSSQHFHDGRGGVRGEVGVHGRRETQEYARPTEIREASARGRIYTSGNRIEEAQHPYDWVEEAYPPEAIPMETMEEIGGTGEGTMFLPHHEGYSYMLVPSHLEDDVAGLIFNAESLPVYEGPIHQPSTLSSPTDARDTQQPSQAPSNRSPISSTPARGLHLHLETSGANQDIEVPPSPINTTPGNGLWLAALGANQHAEAPVYQSPISITPGNFLHLAASGTNPQIETPLYLAPVSTTPGNGNQQVEAPPYVSPVGGTPETDDLPAYRLPSPVVSRSSSVRPQADELPAYRAPSPIAAPAVISPTTNTSASIPPPAPLFATPARPVATALAIPRATPTDNRPEGSILRVRDPIPGTTYPFDPAATRTPEERAAHEAFTLALFTQHNSRPSLPNVAHNAHIDQLLTEEEVFASDVEAYNARQEWRERQAEDRRVRYQERQRLRESQAVGEVDEAAEEMYQLQEAIQMSLEEAESDGTWGWAADEEEVVDEDLAQAMELSLRTAQAGRDYHHPGRPRYQPSVHQAQHGYDQPRPNIIQHSRSTEVRPAQLRATRFENAHFVQTLQIPQAIPQCAAWGNTLSSPTIRDRRSSSTDTNKPLPGLPPV